MQREFSRIAIVNRGEPAMRLINAVQELNQANKNDKRLETIVFFTEPDQKALFVREADESISLGKAFFVDSADGKRKSSYLDYQRLEKAIINSRVDAVWVGWGFVAEHAEFADLCKRLGVVFIGPSGDVMRKLGDKISSKLLAEEAQVPITPWSGGAVDNLEQAYLHANKIGYPLMIKATAGGGGRGIRKVESSADLAVAFESARAEALASFGNETVFLEKMVKAARHIEVQIIGDHYGNVWAVGVRDCSVQRRHQKLIEESASTQLNKEQEEFLRSAAVRLAKVAGYQNAGTVEFLYDVENQSFSFMEVNARLQVEHPVTEVTTGLDLVKLQIHVARGGKLEGEAPLTTGHAIEVRLNAEDADNNFAPAPGIIKLFRIPTGPGIRVDKGISTGDAIAPEFDSMIAKIIAYGNNRSEALSRLKRALNQCSIVVQGGTTNKAFMLSLLNQPDFENGNISIDWLDNISNKKALLSHRYAEIALIQAAINIYQEEFVVEQSQFYRSAERGCPHVHADIGYSIELRYQENLYKLTVYCLGLQEYQVDLAGRRVYVFVDDKTQFEKRLLIANSAGKLDMGRNFRILSVVDKNSHRIEVDGIPHNILRNESGLICSPSPAVVVSIDVKEGDKVNVGDQIAVLEAMKMEMCINSAFAGEVKQVFARSNVQVGVGSPLIRIDPDTKQTEAKSSETISFDTIDLILNPISTKTNKDLNKELYLENIDKMRRFLLGFDIATSEIKALITQSNQLLEKLNPADETLLRKEEELLEIFLNLNSLFRRQPVHSEFEGEEVFISDEYIITYLRSFDSKAPGIPKSFFDKLKQVVACYGLNNLDTCPKLIESMLWIFKSKQRAEQNITPILSVLERRLEKADILIKVVSKDFRELLERLIAVTANRVLAVNDVARELQYCYFEKPLFEQSRDNFYSQINDQLDYLALHPTISDWDERIKTLIECPYPVVGVFSKRFEKGDLATQQLMLEVMTRRYYRVRQLKNFRSLRIKNHNFAVAEYDFESKHIHLVTTHTEFSKINESIELINSLLIDFPLENDVVIDFYVWQPQLIEAEVNQKEIQDVISNFKFSRPLRRIVLALTCSECQENNKTLQHFTYRPVYASDSTSSLTKEIIGYQEEKVYRNLHPMMGKRLHLWRLSNFNIERLPSIEDIYLFRAVAKENVKDERLFALAEVRDLTPVKNEGGQIVQLPHMERMLMETLTAIRLFQSKRNINERLQWNRVLLYVWPVLNLKPAEFDRIVRNIAPATEGLGLEQVTVDAKIIDPVTKEITNTFIIFSNTSGKGLTIRFIPIPEKPIGVLTEYEQKVVRLKQRGLLYPYELIKMIVPRQDEKSDFPTGEFIEYDLNESNCLIPVNRPYGKNRANIIVGVIRNFTSKYPEGMTRVVLLGDPSKEMGSLAEIECRRIISAIELATTMKVPLEWFALSAGAKISMESGTENMDWIALVLRYIVNYTQSGGEVNIIVNGINVGAQPYWNAEATMLMHTRGILIMTGEGAMVLTGKQALDYSGSVSAEDNFGIGGYERTMGPNGQAQYYAPNINEACKILFRYYDHSYILPGENFPRRAITQDKSNRNVCDYPHSNNADEFATVGEVFSNEKNSGRKKPFDIRRVMKAVTDQDHLPLERWVGMRDADTGVIWDAHIGGYPVCLIGFESHPIARSGFISADGPDHWTSGTLFPQSSKKIARAINSASNNRPIVVLANLAGFDGSPESMRKLQLEYGAEIGRAVVNFQGPIIFCVISRYHGGAFVVFSKQLNDQMSVIALTGTYASVIGGAPAAAVVFARDVDSRTKKDPRIQDMEKNIVVAPEGEKRRLKVALAELYKSVRSEKLGEVANEFDHIHSVHRALKVGSLDKIISPEELREYLINALEQAMKSNQ
jgi:acetyl/propionyl-CoA carboxylase alpha subunit/acetyl-CoA carboxylase carboxyltransferase component